MHEDSTFFLVRSKFNILLFAVATAVVVVRYNYPPHLFADYPSYLYLIDSYAYNTPTTWLLSEPLSWLGFSIFRLISGSTQGAVDIANWYISAIYVASLYMLNRRYSVEWQGAAVICAIFGSLLAFVTLRATPAYMIVTIAVFESALGRKSSLAICAIAMLFHVSAALAVIPVMLTIMQTRYSSIEKFVNKKYIVPVIGLVFFVMWILSTESSQYLIEAIISSVPPLAKFATYLQIQDGSRAIEPIKDGSSHQIYFIICSLVAGFHIIFAEKKFSRVRIYVMSSYIIFILLSFSPVSAFRQSIFWLIPAFLTLPWGRFRLAGFGSAFLAAACIFVFVANFDSVLVR